MKETVYLSTRHVGVIYFGSHDISQQYAGSEVHFELKNNPVLLMTIGTYEHQQPHCYSAQLVKHVLKLVS